MGYQQWWFSLLWSCSNWEFGFSLFEKGFNFIVNSIWHFLSWQMRSPGCFFWNGQVGVYMSEHSVGTWSTLFIYEALKSLYWWLHQIKHKDDDLILKFLLYRLLTGRNLTLCNCVRSQQEKTLMPFPISCWGSTLGMLGSTSTQTYLQRLHKSSRNSTSSSGNRTKEQTAPPSPRGSWSPWFDWQR